MVRNSEELVIITRQKDTIRQKYKRFKQGSLDIEVQLEKQ